tara:strand:- start:249 stop:1523 length:1275 start_codon:yes stop_codon:yes gene_type:complete
MDVQTPSSTLKFNNTINCILLSPHGRSGSVFFHSLLDSHPQVACLPSINIRYSFPEVVTNITDALDSFVKNNQHVFDTSKGYLGVKEENVTSLFGPDQDEHLRVDASKFKMAALCYEFDEALRAGQPISRKDFVVGIYKAYARSNGQDPNNLKYILFHAHSYKFNCHKDILADFPDLFYIAMTRDPREDWLGWDKVCKLRNGKHYDSMVRDAALFSAIKSYHCSVLSLCEFSKKLKPAHLKIIDLNRFHGLNSDAMILLSKYFGIEFLDSLLCSTFLGEPWLGNSADRSPISGFDPKRSAYCWPALLSSKDERIISSALSEPIRMLGYPTGTLSGDGKLETSLKDILVLHIKYLGVEIGRIRHRKEFNTRILRKVPLLFSKTIHLFYFMTFTSVRRLIKLLSLRSWIPNNALLSRHKFNSADFL